MKKILTGILILVSVSLKSQNRTVSGIVRDSKTYKPVAGATIIRLHPYGIFWTDSVGRFIFDSVLLGKDTFSFYSSSHNVDITRMVIKDTFTTVYVQVAGSNDNIISFWHFRQRKMAKKERRQIFKEAPQRISGTVFHFDTKEVLGWCYIETKKSGVATNSDSTGHFSVIVTNPKEVLRFGYVGFETRRVKVKNIRLGKPLKVFLTAHRYYDCCLE